MSEQTIHRSNDLRALLAGAGAQAYVLAYADTVTDPTSWEAPPPDVGRTGIVRAADRAALQEVCQGPLETLRRWLHWEDGRRQITILTADQDELREVTPGELAADLVRDPASDAQITDWLGGWLYRRYAQASEGLELGWMTASAAWTCHMRALSGYPPASVLGRALEQAGERDGATEELVSSTGMQLAELLERMERTSRPRSELVQDWHTVARLSADVPALRACADWLLDQIALRDRGAQRLRAALEPDITEHLHERRLDTPAAVLDGQRSKHLAQARATVREYTAAAYSGREGEAQQLLDAFPLPDRSLDVSGPARAWRQRSALAREAVNAVHARWDAATDAVMGVDLTGPFADSERLNAQLVYLRAREARLDLAHDALGRLAAGPVVPPDLPEELHEVAAGLGERRLAEAFGSLARAREALEGQIAYLEQEPAAAHRREETAAELDLLRGIRRALEPVPAETGYDTTEIERRAAELTSASLARSVEASPRPDRPSGQQTRVAHAPVQPLTAQPGSGGVRP
jgi:hypothetical protein